MTFSAVLLLAPLVLSAGCSTTYRLTASGEVPAAEGTARLKLGPNGNARLEIEVAHLAEPGHVSAGAMSYVAWARADLAATQPQNLGAIELDSHLSGSLHTVTAFPSFELFITPEATAGVAAPTGTHVLAAHVSTR